MGAFVFKGGIHPDDNKRYTEDIGSESLFALKGMDFVFPMSQHIGAPCEPIVEVGERVLDGQKIADSTAFVSSPIFSSISGTVKDIKEVELARGNKSLAIIIENDAKFDEIESDLAIKDYSVLNKDEVLKSIRNAGVVGLGGAGFPTHIKLSPPEGSKIDSIIINGAECEPYLTTDYRIMLEETDRLVRGLEIVLGIFSDAKGYIAVEKNKPKAIKKLKEAVKGSKNIEIVELPTKFPQGAEKQLIKSITNREIPSGKLPADVGCIVDNIDTIIAIERAIVRNRPLVRRIFTLSGSAVKNPGNYKVRIGMKLKDLVEMTGGFKEEPKKLILGGPMMGVSIYNLDAPILKTTSALLAFLDHEFDASKETNCIRCGKCSEVCPMGLQPNYLNQYVIAGDFNKFKEENGLDCIECGSCSYICPAKRHLTQSCSAGKLILAKSAKK